MKDNITLLLVEDNPVDQRAFTRAVSNQARPYTCTLAESVAEAREQLRAFAFDLVVTDYHLGDGTAFDLFPLLDDTPFIVMSGQGNESIAVAAMKAGAYDYIIKDPHDNYLLTLQMTLERALEHWEAKQTVDHYQQYLETIITERTTTLQETESQLHSLVESSSNHIFMLTRQGVYLFSNNRVGQFGLKGGRSLIGHHLRDVYSPEVAGFYEQQMNKVLATEQAVDFEHPMHEPDGSHHHLDTLYPIRRDDEIWAIGGICRDITQLKQTQEAYRALVDYSLQGLCIVQEGQVVFANNTLAEMFGYSVEALLAMPREQVLKALTPEGRAFVRRLSEARRAGEDVPLHYEIQVRARDGDLRWTEQFVTAIKYKGRPALQIVVIDVTERKEAMEQLRESESRYRELVETIPYGVEEVDLEGRRVFLNEAYYEILGYEPGKLVGTYIWDHDPQPEQVQRLKEYWAHIKDEQPPPEPYISQNVRKDGTVIDVHIDWDYKRAANGDLEGFISIVTDITERKRAQKALELRAAQLLTLNEIGAEIAGALDLNVIFECATRLIQERFDYHHVGLFIWDEEQKRLVMRARAGEVVALPPLDHQLSLGEGLVGWAAAHDEILLVSDVDQDPRYVDRNPAEVMTKSELSVPIQIGDDVVGVLDVQSQQRDAFDENDVLVMETLARQIAVAMERARLYKAERETREQLQGLASYLQDARERERTRIAREIHDEFGQALTALKMDIAWLDKRLSADPQLLREKLEAMSDLVDGTISTVRRVATELRPGLLDDLGLIPAMEWQAEEFSRHTGIACRLDAAIDGELQLDQQLATAIFRIFQEALTNVARHAEATAVTATLRRDASTLLLTIQDNGQGIEPAQADSRHSLGLIGMQERAHVWNGEVTFVGEPGRGTTVTLRVPQEDYT